MARIHIIGGGFRGMACAFLARQAGHEVTLIEAARRLGGILNCVSWKGFHLDFGCHLFDNVDDRATSLIFEMAGGEDVFHSVNVRYASKTMNETVEGIAIPSFQELPEEIKSSILFDLVKTCSQPGTPPENLGMALAGRFGNEIALRLIPMAAKMFAGDPDNLAGSALKIGLFRRVRFLDDDVARWLKSLPALDDRLAVSSVVDPLEFCTDVSRWSFRNFYPARGGMESFTKATERTLRGMGVDILLRAEIKRVRQVGEIFETELATGEILSADLAFSALAPEANERLFLGKGTLSELTWAVPMVLVYFSVPTDELTGVHYLHNFNDRELTFRASAPGLYGRQIKSDGTTYVCAELPTTRDGQVWTEAETLIPDIWHELQLDGLISRGAQHEDFHILRIPKSYSVGRVGHEARLAEVQADLVRCYPSVHFSADMFFAKSEILAEVMRIAEAKLGWNQGSQLGTLQGASVSAR